jgi:hypothetical protein
MKNVYAVRQEEGRLIAAEVDEATAAVLSIEGVSIWVLRPEELEDLARRQNRMLVALPRGSVTCFRPRRKTSVQRLHRGERYVVPANRPRLLDPRTAWRMSGVVHQV